MPTESELTIAGELVTLRPIQAADAAMEADFIRRLSPQTKHYRFFGGVNELTPDEVAKLCEVDGHRSMAFVATIRREGRELQIGVCRYAAGERDEMREMAVTVADEWQHRGLGVILARRLIEAAKEHGVRELYSVELADNAAMHGIARDLGMSARRDPDDPQQIIYSLPL